MGFMVDEMALGRGFLRVRRFYRDTTLHQCDELIHLSGRELTTRQHTDSYTCHTYK
jgi:hypothetical protein